MKAEKTREVINRWYTQQCYKTEKFTTKTFAMKLESETLEELSHIEEMASKQESKEIVSRFNGNAYEEFCPICKNEVWDEKYCSECGQKLCRNGND